MTAEQLRPELPQPLPPRMRSLPLHRGYPVPFFVTWFDNGVHVQRGEGEPDFRIITAETIAQAVGERRCWVCGGKLGVHMSFVIGPMCAVNRNTAEPPCHLDCADWSARACPFLSRPHARRNEAKDKHGAGVEHVAGTMIKRNPGVALVWTTKGYRIHRDGRGGVLFEIGVAEHVRWYKEGRPATRAEVQHSIDTGLPFLTELAEQDGELAVKALNLAVKRAEPLLPVA